MANSSEEKFTPACKESLKKTRKDEISTVIVRTKLKANSEKEARMAVEMLQIEQMATRRRQLLARVQGHYGKGLEFYKNYRDSRLKGQAKLVGAAPKAVNLWAADCVAVSGTKAELEDLAGHPEVESIDVNPTLRIPRVLQTPPEDTPEIIDGRSCQLSKHAVLRKSESTGTTKEACSRARSWTSSTRQ